MYSDPKKFDEFTGSNPCLCFTATPGGAPLEEDVLVFLKMNVVKSTTDIKKTLEIDR